MVGVIIVVVVFLITFPLYLWLFNKLLPDRWTG